MESKGDETDMNNQSTTACSSHGCPPARVRTGGMRIGFLWCAAVLSMLAAVNSLGAQPSFNGTPMFQAGRMPHSVAMGDFNGDGNQDLVVANKGSNDVSILLGNGKGGFLPAVNYAAGSKPWSVVVGDFNRDGKPDLAVANAASNNISILLGNGNGAFQPAVSYAVGSAGLDPRG